MPTRQHTIIVIPHARAKLRKWRVTSLQIALAAGSLLLLTVIAFTFIWFHLRSRINPVEISRLQQENDQLRAVNQSFEESIRHLQDQIVQSEGRARQLAIVAGIDSLGGSGEAGVGGGAPLDEAAGLPDLESRASELTATLNAIEERLSERMRWISSTPAIAPVKGILTSGFGYRADPMTHGRGVHQGIDIAAPQGQPVRASADGVVMRATSVGGFGQAVFIAHGFGVTTGYGHLSRIDVRPGQRVKRGDLLGLVGSTGRSTAPHLHYEVRIDGDPVNPLAYILDSAGR
jgi:murein DD-endopeptidase MepM/ murein hydrolase activator NlpD